MSKKTWGMRLAPFGLAALVFLGGCGVPQVPRTESFPASAQRVARVASHWDVLADDVAARTMEALGDHKTIRVSAPKEPTEFNRAFRNLLVTRLVNKGLTVSSENPAAIEIQYETQVITHDGERYLYRPERVTVSAAGLLVAYDVPNGAHAPDSPAAASYMRIEAEHPAKTELVVTISATENGRYVLRKTNIYYIEPEDVPLFLYAEERGIPVREFRVVGSK